MTVGEEGRDSRHIIWQREYVSEETVMLRWWFEGGGEGGGGRKEFQDNLVSSVEIISWPLERASKADFSSVGPSSE